MTTPATKRQFDKVELNKLVKLIYGEALPSNKRVGGTVPVYGSNGIVGNHNQFLTDKKTIVVGRKGSVGKVHLTNGPSWVIDTAFYTDVDVNIDLQYLFYFLSSLTNKLVFPKGVKPGINRQEYLKNLISIPVSNGKPDLNEQKRIANKLTALFAEIDKAIEKTKSGITSSSSLYNSLLSKIFTDSGFIKVPFGKLVTIYDNKRVPINSSARAKIQGEFPYLGANGVVDCIDKYIFDGEYILIAEDGGFFKPFEQTAYIFSGKFWVNNHAHIVQANNLTTLKWLYYFFTFEDIRKYCSGATRLKLNQEKMKMIPVPLPHLGNKPDLVKQKKYIEELDNVYLGIQKMIKDYENQQKQLDKLKQSLLNQAFEGKL